LKIPSCLPTAGVLFLAAWSAGGRAADSDFTEGLPGLESHAFVSQGYIKSTGNNYLAKSKAGSFNFSEVGINFTKQLRDDLRMGVQLFARNLGASGNLDAKMDWFYLDYRHSDYLGIRFGRVKLPFGLYNGTNDVDAARVPVLLPQSIYPTQNRQYLLAQTGAELYGNTGRGEAGSLEYRVYGGTIFLDLPTAAGSSVQTRDLNVPYVVGGRLLWSSPVDGLQLGATLQALRLDTTFVAGSALPFSIRIPVRQWVGSAEYAKHDLLLATEYSRWDVRITGSSNVALIPNSEVTSERAYVMAAYRLNPWIQPALYYSVLYPNADHRRGLANHLNDLSATLRFDVNTFWLVKLEGHYMEGTAGLNSALNDNIPLGKLAKKWTMFFVKTTGYF
jgi:hypothetical protein